MAGVQGRNVLRELKDTLGGWWICHYLEYDDGFSSVHILFSSVQSLSCVWLFETPWIAACQASLSITNSRSSLRFPFIESVMPSSHLIHYRPLLLLSPIPPSIRVFSNESTLHMRWPGKPSKMQYRECNKWLTACSWTRALEFDRNTSDLRLFVLPPKKQNKQQKTINKAIVLK